jgi:iron complex outermembrane receptor protein
VRTNSRGETELSVRGSESRQVAVLFDGMPLTLGWDGRTDVSVIPAGVLQEVSLVRGLSTLLAGPNVLGGVVEFRTGAAGGHRGPAAVSLRSGVDHVGAFGVSGSVTAAQPLSAGRLTMCSGLGHRDTPGSTLAHGVVEPVPGDDLRANSDLSETDAFASLRFDRAAGGWLSLAGSAFRAERGIAAELGVDAPRLWRYPYIARALTVLSGGSGIHRAPWGGEASVQASAGLDAGRTEIDAYDSRAYDAVAGEEDCDQRTLSVRATGTQTFGRRGDLRIGVTSGEVTFDERLNAGPLTRYRQRVWSVGGESVVRFPRAGHGVLDEVDVSAGLAFDRSTYPLSGNAPGLGANIEWGGRLGASALLADGRVTLHAGATRRARFPSLRELFSGSLGRFDPNPNLEPEKLVAAEGGVTLRDARGTLQIVGFHQRLGDAVVRVRNGSLFRRVNQEGLVSAGLEGAGARNFGAAVLSGRLVGQSVRLLDREAGFERPENLPGWSGSVRAEWTPLARDNRRGCALDGGSARDRSRHGRARHAAGARARRCRTRPRMADRRRVALRAAYADRRGEPRERGDLRRVRSARARPHIPLRGARAITAAPATRTRTRLANLT